MRRAPFLILLALPVLAHPDDGFLTRSGAPRLLSKHPSVRMVRERVVVTIRPKGYHVDATFLFRNDGPALSVRMGFPDDGRDEEDPGPGKTAEPLESLAHFRSWVDGVPAPTTLVRNREDATTWHTKRVAFRAHATRRVRVAYDADGGGATSGGRPIRQADYVMRTGASWRGPIGFAELIVRFAPGTLAGEIRPIDTDTLKSGSPYELSDWDKLASGTVFWSGFAKPTVRGRELRFVRRRFEPTEDDDVNVYFGFGHRFE